MATRAPRYARAGRRTHQTHEPSRRPGSLTQLSTDRRGGALVEYVLIGLVAMVGLVAWPKLETSSSKKLKVQAECGLLNADCGGGSASGSSQATPVAGTPGLQGKLDQLAKPTRRVPPARKLQDTAILDTLTSLANGIKDLAAQANQQPNANEMLRLMQPGAPGP